MSTIAEPLPTTNEKQVPWLSMAWFFGLLVLCYAPVLWRLVNQWNNDEDMGHGFFVPAIAAYIAWQHRGQLLARPLKPNYWGLAIMAFAALQLMVATLGAELFLARTAFVESIIGITLFLGGTYAVRVMAFPLFLLFFMVPIPAVIYNQITFPLQLFASQVAEVSLNLIGIPVYRDGNVLELASQKLSVVEACSGIRSLLSLTFLSLVYAYFFDSKVWMRVTLFLSTIPIAIVANAGRVTLTGILSEYKPELAHGFFHTASGWVIFMIALAILIALHQFLNRAYQAMHEQA
ncbi:MAG TPA: exosortase/archaeosortase family protein [Bryobacteraceae bacterium]|nr:exosortase/archaeosortase family protein [Bryobacteraceae bacterium]